MASDPLELDLQAALSPHVGAGSGNWVLCKSTKCFNLQAVCLAPASFFLNKLNRFGILPYSSQALLFQVSTLLYDT